MWTNIGETIERHEYRSEGLERNVVNDAGRDAVTIENRRKWSGPLVHIREGREEPALRS